MSYYIKPKFKVGEEVFSIVGDDIICRKVRTIQIDNINHISYIDESNKHFNEELSFFSRKEAENFKEESCRIPNLKGDVVWVSNNLGVRMDTLKDDGVYYFQDDLHKPFNKRAHVGDCFNESNFFESQEDATLASLKALGLYNQYMDSLIKKKTKEFNDKISLFQKEVDIKNTTKNIDYLRIKKIHNDISGLRGDTDSFKDCYELSKKYLLQLQNRLKD